MDKFTDWLKARALERSTKIGAGLLSVALGAFVSPETAGHIVSVLTFLIGAFQVIRDEGTDGT